MTVGESYRSGITVLTPTTDLDGLGYASLKERCEQTLEHGRHQVVLDLSQVHYVNSICIGYLVQFWQRLLGKGGSFAVARCQQDVKRLISYSGIDRKIPFHDDLDAAIADAGNAHAGQGVALDAQTFYTLLTSYMRVGLSRLISQEAREADTPRFLARGWAVALRGEIEGSIGISIDQASSDRLHALLAEKFQQDGMTPDETNAYVLDTLFGSACSGIEEMGYEIEHGPMRGSDLSPGSRPAQLDFSGGAVGLAFDLVLRGTKRNRAVQIDD